MSIAISISFGRKYVIRQRELINNYLIFSVSSLDLKIIEELLGCFCLLSVLLAFSILANIPLERTEILDLHLQDSSVLLSATSQTDLFSWSFDVQLNPGKNSFV